MTDLLIAGPPGPLFRWVCDLVLAAAGSQGVRVATRYLDHDDVWAEDEPAPDTDLRLLTAHRPSNALLAAAGTRVRVLLVIDQPARSLAELRLSGHELLTSLRHLSACVTPMGALMGREAVMTVTADAVTATTQVTQAILGFAGLVAPPEELIPAVAADADASEPESAAAELISAVLRPGFQYAASGARRPAAWPRACLYWGDRPGEPVPRIIDLTGPARVLVYGPYLHLPAGRWTVRAIVAFSQSCHGAPFALELHGSSAELGRARFRVPGAGLFQIACQATVPSESEPLEIRLVTERGAIEGALGIDRVDLQPEPDEAGESIG